MVKKRFLSHRSPVIGSAINTSSLSQSETTDYINNLIFVGGTLSHVLGVASGAITEVAIDTTTAIITEVSYEMLEKQLRKIDKWIEVYTRGVYKRS
ncbi:hypothetical protein M2137_000222 [Parabacteroides sp. PFB2-10]|uniref:hypothetical protein n=1 Tax=Parabacteroides sp. PFB2-10 TaxID=1742405 RepID=UPI002473F507|nr:hypothetical protein [Parabacteroides sp. PFB2-10]MDH6311472.1 hypothetical protein [Parabacteroides sp. PFB2-10]